MLDINLLKEDRVAEQVKIKKLVSKIILLSILIILCLHFFLQKKCDAALRQVQALKEQIHLKSLPEDSNSQNGINIVEDNKINSRRESLQTFLAQLFAEKDPEVCLTEVSQTNHQVAFAGYASSVLELIKFIQQWQNLPLFPVVQIQKIIQQEPHLVNFYFQINSENKRQREESFDVSLEDQAGIEQENDL